MAVWNPQANELFLHALEKTAAERSPFLEQVCQGDTALRAQVDSLLAAAAQAGDFLEQPAADGLTDAFSLHPEAATSELAADTRVMSIPDAPSTLIDGRYRLLEKLGEGGMGSVYLAEQTQPIKRRVAVKIVKMGLDSRSVLARFEAERQALALMDHPHIAKVFDAGNIGDRGDNAASSPGRPYFVMEFVRGVPLTQFCDEQQLRIPDRLRLFQDICQAVQHAHQKGIVHRDLKPSNILVAAVDGKPVAKVIDFGLAKALHSLPLTEGGLVTQAGAILGTPLYMAPEQAGGPLLDIDTRADIYALGVLLYEMLTGTTPLDRPRLEQLGWAEVCRVIKEEEPSAPSARLRGSKHLTALSTQRRLEPGPLLRTVHGDLDWITMKALAKERDRRYDTAAALAGDVARYLRDEPVTAGPPTVGYQVRKFVRRHRGPVLAAALLVLTLVGGIIGTAWGLVQAEEAFHAEAWHRRQAEANAQTARAAQRQAEAAEKDARASEADTQAFSRFLVHDLLAVARPKGQQGGLGVDVTVKQAILAALRHIPERFQERPRAEAVARHALGVTLRLAGDPVQAVTQLERALTLRKEILPPDHPDRLETRNSLAMAYLDAGQHDRALPLLEEMLSYYRRVRGAQDADTLIVMNNLAGLYQTRGDFARAEPLLRQALDTSRRLHGEEHPDTLRGMNNLAGFYQARGQPAQAEPLYVRTLEIARRVWGEEYPHTVTTMNNLAGVYQALGKYAQAEPLYVRSLEISRRIRGEDHPYTIQAINNLATLFWTTRRLDRSVPLFEEAYRKCQARLEPDHPTTLLAMLNLGINYRDAGRLAEGTVLLEQAWERTQRRPGPVPTSLTSLPTSLASTYERAGQHAKAESLYRYAVDQARQRHGATLPTARVLGFLGENLLHQHKYTEAEPPLRECLALREKYQPQAWATFTTQMRLGACLQGQGKYAEAERLLTAAYEGMRQRQVRLSTTARQEMREAVQQLIKLYQAWNKPVEAARWQQELER